MGRYRMAWLRLSDERETLPPTLALIDCKERTYTFPADGTEESTTEFFPGSVVTAGAIMICKLPAKQFTLNNGPAAGRPGRRALSQGSAPPRSVPQRDMSSPECADEH
jgi:hypothetical protein